MDWTQYALRRTLPGAEHGRRPPVEAVAMSAFLFHVFFTFWVFLDFLHFGHIHVFCEEGVKMCFSCFGYFPPFSCVGNSSIGSQIVGISTFL